MNIALRIAKWAVLAAALFVATIFAVNLYDEAPSGELAGLRRGKAPEIAPHDNAYLALLGLNAPPGLDPIDEGARIVAEHDADTALPPLERFKRIDSRGPGARPVGLKFVGPAPVVCSAVASPCLQAASRRATRIAEQLEANAELVARYREATKLARFEETAQPSPVFNPVPFGSSQVQRLLLNRAAWDARNGRGAAALAFLRNDLQFWHSVIDSGPSLITTLIAASAIRNDLALLAEMLGDAEVDVRPHAAELDASLRSLRTLSGYAGTIAREFEQNAKFVEESFASDGDWPESTWHDALQDWMFRRFVRPTATINRMAREARVVQDIATHLPARCGDLRDLRSAAREGSGPQVDWLFNPVGKSLVTMGAGSHATYALRLCDLANEATLVRAQLAVRLDNVTPGKVAAMLASRPDLANVHTRASFDWAEGARVLSFVS